MCQAVIVGGFVTGYTSGDAPIIRSPAARPVMELIDNVLAITRLVQLLLLCRSFSVFTNKVEEC